MKVTTNIIKPPIPTPILDKVVIELEPREAFLLAMLLGNQSPNEKRQTANYHGFAEKGGDLCVGGRGWGHRVKGDCSHDESFIFGNIYKEIRRNFIIFEENNYNSCS